MSGEPRLDDISIHGETSDDDLGGSLTISCQSCSYSRTWLWADPSLADVLAAVEADHRQHVARPDAPPP